MPGASPYDDEARGLRERTEAEGIVIVVIGGKYGHAYAVQGSVELHLNLPRLLRAAADEAEAYQKTAEFASWLAEQHSAQSKQ